MFKYLNLDSIIKSVKIQAIKYKNIINSLMNLSRKLNYFKSDIPAISIFQAFMVIEIGKSFGFISNEINFEMESYLRRIQEEFSQENFSLPKSEEEGKIKAIDLNINIIQEQIENNLNGSNNSLLDVIETLSNLFSAVKEKCGKNKISEDILNRRITDKICLFCVSYFEEQLKKTNGLIIWNQYYDICNSIKDQYEMECKSSFTKYEIEKLFLRVM